MSNDKIEEIRARHEEGIRAGADEDRAYLLAEVERLHKAHQAACEGGDLLRAELMQAIGLLEARLDTAIRERDEARAEVERLRGDAQAISAIAHTGGTAGLSEHEALVEIRRRTLKAWDRKTSRAALEAKP